MLCIYIHCIVKKAEKNMKLYFIPYIFILNKLNNSLTLHFKIICTFRTDIK